jgi:hypothetical protein
MKGGYDFLLVKKSVPGYSQVTTCLNQTTAARFILVLVPVPLLSGYEPQKDGATAGISRITEYYNFRTVQPRRQMLIW